MNLRVLQTFWENSDLMLKTGLALQHMTEFQYGCAFQVLVQINIQILEKNTELDSSLKSACKFKSLIKSRSTASARLSAYGP